MPNKNILIVEDNMIIAIDLQESLSRFGYNIQAIATTGEQALVKTAAEKPDLVIMDIGLKGNMNGIEAGKKIREYYSIPILYLTGNSNLLKAANISDPWIDKPYSDDELKRVINSLLGKPKDDLSG